MPEYPSRAERVPGQYSETTMIDKAINKYGGKDEQYKLALKQQIRDYMGYANYVGRMNKVDTPNSPMRLPEGPMTPGGASSAYGSANANQLKELEYLKELARNANTVGGDLAADKLAKAKAAGKKEIKGIFETMGKFQPMDDTDASFKEWMNNPTGANGRYEDIETWKKREIQRLMQETPLSEEKDGGLAAATARVEEVVDRRMPNTGVPSEDKVYDTSYTVTETGKKVQQSYTDPGMKTVMMNQLKEEHPSATPEEIQALYDEKMIAFPENLQYKHQYEYYAAQGLTEAQIAAEIDKDNYANEKMSPGEKSLYEQNHPAEIKEVEVLKSAPGLKQDLTPKLTEDGKTSSLTKSFDQLAEEYPGVDRTTLENMARPAYTADAQQDVDTYLNTKPTSTDVDGNAVAGAEPKRAFETVISQDEAKAAVAGFTDGMGATVTSVDGSTTTVGGKEDFEATAQWIADNNGLVTKAEVMDMMRKRATTMAAASVARAQQIKAELKRQRPEATPEELDARTRELMSAGQQAPQ